MEATSDSQTLSANDGVSSDYMSLASSATRWCSFVDSDIEPQSDLKPTIFSNAERNHTGSPLQVLDFLMRDLREYQIPGPRLVRLKKEFTEQLGHGASFTVLGFDPVLGNRLLDALRQSVQNGHDEARSTRRRVTNSLFRVAVKKTKTENKFSAQVDAARREIYTLCKPLFRNHANLVRLVAWGLDLDLLEDDRANAPAIPLLILERADMNLSQYLSGNDDGRFIWKFCQDVGSGLEALHLEEVVHGDIKPDNVLVYLNPRRPSRTIAKICDFGFAGQDHEKVPGPRSQYRGTKGWRPPEIAQAEFDPAKMPPMGQLRKCDIFAYGLLVWSALLRRGESPLGKPGACESKELDGRAHSLALREVKRAKRISAREVLLATCIFQASLSSDPSQRAMRPWAYLDGAYPDGFDLNVPYSAAWYYTLDPYPSLDRSVVIDNLHTVIHPKGWKPAAASPSDVGRTTIHSGDLIQQATAVPATANATTISTSYPIEIDNRLSDEATDPYLILRSETMHLYQDPALFETDVLHRSGCSMRISLWLSQQISDIINKIRGADPTLQHQKLYRIAYCRSQMRLCCWCKAERAMSTSVGNVLEKMLSLAVPLPTLAWLTRGEVGQCEVEELRASGDLWWLGACEPKLQLRTPIDQDYRVQIVLFLLDIMSDIEGEGAMVEELNVPCTRFAAFLSRIDEDTAGVADICRKLAVVAKREDTDDASRFYMTGQLPDGQDEDVISLCKTTVLHDCARWGQYRGVEQLLRQGFPVDVRDASGCTALSLIQKRPFTHQNKPTPAMTRTIALLSNASPHETQDPASTKTLLAAGWKLLSIKQDAQLETAIRRRNSLAFEGYRLGAENLDLLLNGTTILFEDIFLKSLTLKRPTFSFLTDRRLAIGYRKHTATTVDGANSKQVYYLDLLSFLSKQRSKTSDTFNGTLYDERWFQQPPSALLRQQDLRLLGIGYSKYVMPPKVQESGAVWPRKGWTRVSLARGHR